MSEIVTGKFQVVDSKGNAIFTIDADSTFAQIFYKTQGGLKLAEMTDTGHLGLFNPVTGKQNISLDPFNPSGLPHLKVTAEEGNVAPRYNNRSSRWGCQPQYRTAPRCR